MKNIFFNLVFNLLLVGSCNGITNNSLKVSAPNIIIKSIQLGVANDNNEYSILLDLTNHGATIEHWQLGFYMLGTSFYKAVNDIQSFNPNLAMNLCDKQGKCVELQYAKSKTVIEPDLSQGYTNILRPLEHFPLVSGTSYTIKLLNISQWGSGNYSYFPQNFFIILTNDTNASNYLEKIHPIKAEIDAYRPVDYNQNAVNASIIQHLKQNWLDSMPYASTTDLNIIPSPVHLQKTGKNSFIIQKNININNQIKDAKQVASMLADALKVDLNVKSIVYNQDNYNSKILIKPLVNKELIQNNPEGYILTINTDQIIIQATHSAGAYYAFQTLRQLWNNGSKLPTISIVDYPKFKYRGVMIDVARHFFSVSEVKTLIDLMATQKLNTLHLHLSDDEGFRLVISSYPTLQSIGSTRGIGLPMGLMMFPQGTLKADRVYSGSYNENEVADLVAYANARQITLIPEIDLPAHARALIKSLPNSMIDPDDRSQFISSQWYMDDVLPVCTYNSNISIGPEFTTTINNIVNKTSNLFSKQTTLYAIDHEISIGGDEVSPDAWTTNSSCQGSWSNLSALQKSHKFFHMMASSNPTIILSGWQQFVQTSDVALGMMIVPSDKTGHVWVWNSSTPGIDQAAMLANNGYPTVLVYSDLTYFDLAYTPNIYEPGLNWANKYGDTQAALLSALAAVKTINATNPIEQKNIIGLEGALWSENLDTYQQMIYMALPKMAGLAEASWSPSDITVSNDKINWQSLATRLGCGQTGFLAYLNKLHNVKYRGYPYGIKYEVPHWFCN